MKKMGVGVFLTLIIPLLLTFQGLDLTDFGFSVANYDGFFRYPEHVSFFFVNYLTNFMGAVWLALFGGWLGAWSIQLLALVIYGMTTFIVWHWVKNKVPSLWIFSAFFILMILSFKENWFYYNTSTMLFYTLFAYTLYKNTMTFESKWVYLSGILIAFATFARFPNILSVGMGFSYLIYEGFALNQSMNNILRNIGRQWLGIGIGLASVFGTMVLLDHQLIYWNAIRDLLGLASSESHHGSSLLIDLFIEDHKDVIRSVISFVLPSLAAVLAIGWMNAVIYRRFIWLSYGMSIAAGVAGGLYLVHSMQYRPMIEALVGLLYMGLFIIFLVSFRRKQDLHFSALLGLFLVLLVPLGSNVGIKNATFGWLLGFMILLWGVHEWIRLPRGIEIVKSAAIVMGISLLVFGLKLSYDDSYRDSTRSELTYSLSGQELKWKYTTEDRAQVMNELHEELKNHLKPSEVLFATEAMPLLHYTTHTKAYLWTPWASLYEPLEFKSRLVKAKATQGLPVIVRNKFSVFSPDWPNYPEQFRTERYEANRKSVEEFISENGYKKVWENQMFEIWRTK